MPPALALLVSPFVGDISPDDYMNPLASAVVVYGVFLALPLVLILITLLRHRHHRRQAARAEAAYRSDVLLAPGPATVFGKVEYAREADHAVRVEVEQKGTEQESTGNWSHSWTEKDRRVKVHPFYLRHASGQRVRVEPHREALLVDTMDGVIRVNLTQRVRTAELTPDEKVFASGVLHEDLDPEAMAGGGYRDAPRGLVLRPPRSGRMLLSTEPLGRRFNKRAELHHLFARVFLAAVLLYQLALLPYHLRVVAADTVHAPVVGLRHYTTKDDEGDTVDHHEVKLALPGKVVFTDEVTRELYRSLAVGSRLPVRRSPIWPSYLSNVGSGAAAYGGAAAIGGLIWFLLLGGYLLMVTRKRWYEGKLSEGGPGRLQESLESGKETIDLD